MFASFTTYAAAEWLYAVGVHQQRLDVIGGALIFRRAQLGTRRHRHFATRVFTCRIRETFSSSISQVWHDDGPSKRRELG